MGLSGTLSVGNWILGYARSTQSMVLPGGKFFYKKIYIYIFFLWKKPPLRAPLSFFRRKRVKKGTRRATLSEASPPSPLLILLFIYIYIKRKRAAPLPLFLLSSKEEKKSEGGGEKEKEGQKMSWTWFCLPLTGYKTFKFLQPTWGRPLRHKGLESIHSHCPWTMLCKLCLNSECWKPP
jgi:hypothetical protein